MSKPRFLAVHNDEIYIADLGRRNSVFVFAERNFTSFSFQGRSLIYGTSLRNQFDLNCTSVFGGHGRANGEMTEPAGLFIDSGGNIISADSKNDRVQVKTKIFFFQMNSPHFLLNSYIHLMVNIQQHLN
jgi:hypothetical protein